MKYYKKDSIPLEEVSLSLGNRAFDEYGNYVEGDVFGGGAVVMKSVLNDGERVDVYENEDKFLKAFWTITNKTMEGYGIHDFDTEGE